VKASPSPNGRDGRGRFTRGNPGGPGNPAGGHAERLRHALLNAVTEDDVKAIAEALVASAKTGDVQAIRELLNRTMGRPTDADTLARLERLEAVLLNKGKDSPQ
jgi:hypothetical protein